MVENRSLLKKKEILTIGLCGAVIAIGLFFFLHFYKGKNTVFRIVEYPHPALHQTADLIDHVDHSIISLSNRMISTLQYLAMIDFFSRGSLPVGLAAPQVGVSKRLFVCGINGKIKVMINPKIIHRKGTYFSHEGCLSLQSEEKRTVKRSAYVKLKYTDLDNMDRILVARDRHAALVEHEIDHLNGIFNTDY
jgi:peptide deformylase